MSSSSKQVGGKAAVKRDDDEISIGSEDSERSFDSNESMGSLEDFIVNEDSDDEEWLQRRDPKVSRFSDVLADMERRAKALDAKKRKAAPSTTTNKTKK